MMAFRRLSTCPTLPDLIRSAADIRAAQWARTTPIEIWSRPSTLVLLQRRNGSLGAPPASTPQPHAAFARVCFAAASLVLCTCHLLLRVGLVTPNDAVITLRWSCSLTRHGMQFWRHGRLRPQP
jgi:hypothetical protein